MAKETKAQREKRLAAKAAGEPKLIAWSVPPNVAESIHQYLSTRPHAEVRHLIDALEQCPAILDTPAEDATAPAA